MRDRKKLKKMRSTAMVGDSKIKRLLSVIGARTKVALVEAIGEALSETH
jgi:hypothetical protein